MLLTNCIISLLIFLKQGTHRNEVSALNQTISEKALTLAGLEREIIFLTNKLESTEQALCRAEQQVIPE